MNVDQLFQAKSNSLNKKGQNPSRFNVIRACIGLQSCFTGVSLFIINAVIPGPSKEMLIDWMNSGKELMSIHLGGNVK